MADNAQRGSEHELPRQLGRYDVFLPVGSGGMARVYLAIDRLAEPGRELVVIKQMRPELADDEQALRMFVDEGRIALRLDHPNVVRTRDVVAAPPDCYLAMEYLDGQSLLHVIKRLGREDVPLDEHLLVLSQVLAGLEYAHGVGVVHRDVSPSNVLVCYDGQVKLLDFGIAKVAGALAATHQGVLKGKVGYAAPEQCFDGPADPRSDLYAVGVMLWEAVAGRRRSTAPTWTAMLQARIQDAEPSLEEVCPKAPPPLVQMAARALGRDPARRYATAAAFRRDLQAYLTARPSRPGGGSIAALLAGPFERDRSERQRVVEAQLKAGRRRPASGQRPRIRIPAPLPPRLLLAEQLDPVEETTSPIAVDEALLHASRRQSSAPPRASTPPGPRPSLPPEGAPALPLIAAVPPLRVSAPSLALAEDDLPPFAAKQRRGPLVFMAIMVVVAAVAGAAWLLFRSPGRGEPIAAEPSRAATGSLPSTPTADGVAPAVELRVTVTPKEATLRLDGLLVSNPHRARVPLDGREHVLVAHADDHHEMRRVVRFDRNVDLELVLSPLGGSHPRGVRGTRGPLPAPLGPAAEPAAPSTRVEPARPSRVEPGMDLKGRSGSRGRRNLDEKDPYAP